MVNLFPLSPFGNNSLFMLKYVAMQEVIVIQRLSLSVTHKIRVFDIHQYSTQLLSMCFSDRTSSIGHNVYIMLSIIISAIIKKSQNDMLFIIMPSGGGA